MYAERSRGFQLRPVSLGAALAINGGIIAALLMANPESIPRIAPPDPIDIFTPQPEPSPPPPNPPERRAERPSPNPNPTPMIELPIGPPPLPPIPDPGTGSGTDGGAPGTGTGGGTQIVVLPAFVGASFDSRYEQDQQPPFPDFLRDAGIEGAVKLRVLIGPDGRVVRIEALGGNPALVKSRPSTRLLAGGSVRPRAAACPRKAGR